MLCINIVGHRNRGNICGWRTGNTGVSIKTRHIHHKFIDTTGKTYLCALLPRGSVEFSSRYTALKPSHKHNHVLYVHGNTK